MKGRLVKGGVARGVSVMFPSPQIVEILAHAGYDWVLLDCEHGALSAESVELLCMAAEANGITPIARPRHAGAEAILEVLERGAQGVQVPHITSPEGARAVVEAVKYHPLGRRSLAARTRPAGYGLSTRADDFTRRANEETLVCLQVEETEAIDNLDQILAVPGVDVIFVGPSDLSQSLGRPGELDHPEVRRAITRLFSRIVSAGRIAGCAGDTAAWKRYHAAGVTYLYTHLPTVIAAGSEAFLDAEAPISDRIPHPNSHAVQ